MNTAQQLRFTINPDDTVTDHKTGLIWSRNTLARGATFAKAQKAAEALGEGWRLPTADELITLVDRSRYSPAIDTEVFPDTRNDYYWTDTPCAWNTASAVWVVFFSYGFVGFNFRCYLACVRAVRSVPAGQ